MTVIVLVTFLSAATNGASSETGQIVALLLGMVGVVASAYGIYRTNRVDNKAARSTDVNDAINAMKESNTMVKEDLALARARIQAQEDEIEEQAREIAQQTQLIRDQQAHIMALDHKFVRCEKQCADLEARLNQMEEGK